MKFSFEIQLAFWTCLRLACYASCEDAEARENQPYMSVRTLVQRAFNVNYLFLPWCRSQHDISVKLTHEIVA
jgi:hypothetical protein